MLNNPKVVYGVMALVCGPKVTASMIPNDKKAFNEYRSQNTDGDLQISKFPYVSHNGYNFRFWVGATDLYPVYMSSGFEPYYIGHRDYPLFDEVFFGCGRDKISHSTELARAGYSIQIIPDGFIAHLNSDGLGKPWCENWSSDPRAAIKLDIFRRRLDRMIGFNDYVPPWVDADLLKAPVADNKEEEGKGEEEGEKTPDDVKKENEEMKKTIESLNAEVKRLTGKINVEGETTINEEEKKKMEEKNEDEIQKITVEADRTIEKLENEVALLKRTIDSIMEKADESKRITAMTYSVVGVIVSVSFIMVYKYWVKRRSMRSNNVLRR